VVIRLSCDGVIPVISVGSDNIFSAVVHIDEKTPHMHLCFTPITKDGRLSAKEIIGNRTQLTKWQDAFFAHMVKSFPNIERGETASNDDKRQVIGSLITVIHATSENVEIKWKI